MIVELIEKRLKEVKCLKALEMQTERRFPYKITDDEESRVKIEVG